jgi:hypothetical protein
VECSYSILLLFYVSFALQAGSLITMYRFDHVVLFIKRDVTLFRGGNGRFQLFLLIIFYKNATIFIFSIIKLNFMFRICSSYYFMCSNPIHISMNGTRVFFQLCNANSQIIV